MNSASSPFIRVDRICSGVITLLVGIQLLFGVVIGLRIIFGELSHNTHGGWLRIAWFVFLFTGCGIAFCTAGIRLLLRGKRSI